MVTEITTKRKALIAFGVWMVTLTPGWANTTDVRTNVASRLKAEKSLAEFPIGFEVVGSTVKLLGEVKTLEQRDKAARAVAKVDGVEDVVNEIRVAASNEKDFQVRKHIAKEILYYPYYTMFDSVEVGFERGVAALGGYVTEPWKKIEMEKRVRKVEGVTAIENRIEVLPVSIFDDQLRYSISRLLNRDGRFFDLAQRYPAPLHFVVKNSQVTIEGVVVSEVERRAIESLVRQGTLALRVTNRLKTDREVRESKETG